MTTTQELHTLAMDPMAFDTVLARLHTERDKLAQEIARATAKLHELAGDRKSYRNTRVPVWGLSDLEVGRAAQRRAAHGDLVAMNILAQRAGEQAVLDAVNYEIQAMNRFYSSLTKPWTRFFPSVTKSQPHIHRSLSCHTLHATTVMIWAPQLSGRTDAEAVDKLDEALCSVCFPDAPVALHEYVSKRSQAEQDARQAEKDARAAAKAVKTLTEAEQFKTTGRFRERITTVAACKELIRKAVEEAVELEYFEQVAAGTRSWPGDTAMLANRLRNIRERLEELAADSHRAAGILIAREAEHEGWGATEAAIDKMRANKRKSATKEWGL